MVSKIREVDFFARFGGEEFCLILPNTQKIDAADIALYHAKGEGRNRGSLYESPPKVQAGLM